MLVIAITETPNLMYATSVNSLQAELDATFNNPQLNYLSYMFSAIPSIFTLVICSFIIDAFNVVYIYPTF